MGFGGYATFPLTFGDTSGDAFETEHKALLETMSPALDPTEDTAHEIETYAEALALAMVWDAKANAPMRESNRFSLRSWPTVHRDDIVEKAMCDLDIVLEAFEIKEGHDARNEPLLLNGTLGNILETETFWNMLPGSRCSFMIKNGCSTIFWSITDVGSQVHRAEVARFVVLHRLALSRILFL
jgi:hypothetical protein